jgi:hypothetical protein
MLYPTRDGVAKTGGNSATPYIRAGAASLMLLRLNRSNDDTQAHGERVIAQHSTRDGSR